jgi:hypothetical protein
MNEPTTTANPLTIFDDPEVKAALNAFADACCAFGRWMAEVITSAARSIGSWWSTVESTAVPARWAHLARYARKRRTRAKYQRMISRRWAELLGAVMAT